MFNFNLHHQFAVGLIVGLFAVASGDSSFAQPSSNQLISAQNKHPNIGRGATANEIAAWDIDVRPDFLGLPKGSGSVSKGVEIWETKCASCHGSFGESNQIFSPLMGGTTKADIKNGKTARLTDMAYPSRTTMMKVSNLSTLWDYINRAMPWNQPKSMTPDEVYSVLAYMLNVADVVPDNFVLSDGNIRATQKMLPNRDGMTTNHALWPGQDFGQTQQTKKPDVQAKRCLSNCISTTTMPSITSAMPDYAMSAHGNLADQNRLIGPQRGLSTPPANQVKPNNAETNTAPSKNVAANANLSKILADNNCSACHGMETKLVGPSFKEIAAKYGKKDSQTYLEEKIKAGSSGVWGAIPMPAQAISAENAKLVAAWLAQ